LVFAKGKRGMLKKDDSFEKTSEGEEKGYTSHTQGKKKGDSQEVLHMPRAKKKRNAEAGANETAFRNLEELERETSFRSKRYSEIQKSAEEKGKGIMNSQQKKAAHEE